MDDKNLWQKIKKEIISSLDPIDRISEVLFGLIMVLTFTGSISVASDGRAEIRDLLWAALGCNLAWGIVDAVMFLMSSVLTRGHEISVLKKLKLTTDKVAARNLIKDELPPVISSVLKTEEVDQFKERLLKLEDLPKAKLLTPTEFRAAIVIFILVFTCTFPVAVPFIFFSNTAFALRASNGVALLILFFGGFSVGKYSGFHPFWTGTILMILGIILVGITMALGG
jgi:VIT1/CCC1 family predicted Fe2+/Mn2+ transporter